MAQGPLKATVLLKKRPLNEVSFHVIIYRVYQKELNEIIARIEEFIYDDNLNYRDIGSFVFGATEARDDYEDIIRVYPDVYNLAEQGLSLEIEQKNSDYYLTQLRRNFEAFKKKHNL